MKLSSNLLTDFAKTLSEPKSANAKRSVETTVYATVVSTSGTNAVIQIDGSDAQTPAVMVTDCRAGDRVTVKIKNHRATITGNITAPASARSEDRYMRFTEDGLMIGVVDTHGDPTGYYILIQNDKYLIKNQNGDAIASFDADSVKLDSGNGEIKVDGQTLYLLGGRAVGLRSEDKDSSHNEYRSEVVVRSYYSGTPTDNQAGFQVLVNRTTASSVLAVGNNIFMTAANGGDAYINGYMLLNAHNFLRSGEIRAYGTIYGNSSDIEIINVPNIPIGYTLEFVQSSAIYLDNSSHTPRDMSGELNIVTTSVDPSNGTITVVVANTGNSSYNFLIVLIWCALKIEDIARYTPTYIPL